MEKEPAFISPDLQKGLDLFNNRHYLVVQRNDLIQQNRYQLSKNSGNSLSLLEHKVLLYIISKIKPDDTELKEQVFNIKDFCEVVGIGTKGDNYKDLKSAITKLKSRVMWLYTEDAEITVSWIDKAYIYKKSGQVKIRLDEDLKPYLISLRDNYTQFPLSAVLQMRSKYGIALYQLLKSYLFKSKVISFNIEDLKEILDCSSYNNFTNFKKKVLEPALNDINTCSELNVSVSYEKENRTYKRAVFYVREILKSGSLEDREEVAKRKKENDPQQTTLYDL